MEANNLGWELAVRTRSPAEDLSLLNAAHTAAFHWQIVGEEIHRMRAKMLLAEAHALLGLGQTSFALATEVRDFFLKHSPSDWEIAFVHTIYAHAASAAGEVDIHRRAYAEAKEAVDAIADDADRAIVLKTFDQVEKPR